MAVWRRGLLVLAACLFLAALPLPALTPIGPNGLGTPLTGLGLLVPLGMPALFAYPAWWANVAFVGSLAAVSTGRELAGRPLITLAVVLGGSAFVPLVFPVPLPPDGVPGGYQAGPGFALWVAALLAGFVALGRRSDRRRGG
jgi:hypothetical protein